MEHDPFGRPVVRWRNQDLIVAQERYATGHMRLELRSRQGEPEVVATTNVPEASIGPAQVCIKNWRENAGVLEALERAGVVRWTGQVVETGHEDAYLCDLLIPVTVPDIAGVPGAGLRSLFEQQARHFFGDSMTVQELPASPFRQNGRIRPADPVARITTRQNPMLAQMLEQQYQNLGWMSHAEAWDQHRCASCRGLAVTFRDEASRREYAITALCQGCQDQVFVAGEGEVQA